MTPDQNDYFDLLCDLIEKYDRESLPPLKVSAVALLRHFGLRTSDFEPTRSFPEKEILKCPRPQQDQRARFFAFDPRFFKSCHRVGGFRPRIKNHPPRLR